MSIPAQGNISKTEIQRAAQLQQQGRLTEAEAIYGAILRATPGHFDALHLMGVLRHQQGRPAEAAQLLERALAHHPKVAPALSNYGVVLQALGRHAEALAAYDRALAVAPDYHEALANRGIALKELHRLDEALTSLDRALTFKADFVDALNNRGLVLAALRRDAEAIAAFDQAIAVSPRFAEAHHNRGVSLGRLNRHADAIASFEVAIAIKPDYVDALNNYGNGLARLARYAEAATIFERVLALKPDHPFAFGALAYCQRFICHWRDAEALSAELDTRVAAQSSVISPFTFLSFSNDPARQLQCAKNYLQHRVGTVEPFTPVATTRQHDRIRLAYLSGDFRQHAVANLIACLIERHDRLRFEIIGISMGPDDGSAMRARLVKAFDNFHDIRPHSDQDAAGLMRALEIDIAVDLTGWTEHSRMGILAHRPAPVQVNYLGFPGTTGADFIDYIIADEIVLPSDQRRFFTEHIVHLPPCYQINDNRQPISPRVPSRAKMGLPDRGFVFCCFNNTYKLNPDIFHAWMHLLGSIDGSVLWLAQASELAVANLRREAQVRGIDPTRLIFAAKLPSLEDHLARHQLADLFLDTLPYNAHATAGDALWAGLPIVTCLGQTLPGRVGASMLHAIGLPELVTQSLEEYQALALSLARTPPLLHELRQRLWRNRPTMPLFDPERFARHIETAYLTMYQKWQRGEAPDSFGVRI